MDFFLGNGLGIGVVLGAKVWVGVGYMIVYEPCVGGQRCGIGRWAKMVGGDWGTLGEWC